MDKIDTQGMSGPVDPNYKGKSNSQPHKPWLCTPTRVLTETMVKELKILINEVLDEREYQKKLDGPYDIPEDTDWQPEDDGLDYEVNYYG